MTNTNYQKRTARANINRYYSSDMYSLENAYKTASPAKHRAWNYCCNLMKDKSGYGLKVLSYNTFMFTAAFMFVENGIKKLMYITPNYDCVIEIE